MTGAHTRIGYTSIPHPVTHIIHNQCNKRNVMTQFVIDIFCQVLS